nr:major pollen allergen Art v 1-like [Aegilops tauschii subsp. strangulata]
MGLNRTQLFSAFALALLLMSHSVEAIHPRPRICHSPSHLYHGPCNNRKCVEVCHHEHFTGGYCSRKVVVRDLMDENLIRRKRKPYCECTIRCDHSPPPPSEVPEPPPSQGPPPPNVMPAGKVSGGMNH